MRHLQAIGFLLNEQSHKKYHKLELKRLPKIKDTKREIENTVLEEDDLN